MDTMDTTMDTTNNDDRDHDGSNRKRKTADEEVDEEVIVGDVVDDDDEDVVDVDLEESEQQARDAEQQARDAEYLRVQIAENELLPPFMTAEVVAKLQELTTQSYSGIFEDEWNDRIFGKFRSGELVAVKNYLKCRVPMMPYIPTMDYTLEERGSTIRVACNEGCAAVCLSQWLVPITCVFAGTTVHNRLLCYNPRCVLATHSYSATEEEYGQRITCAGLPATCVCRPPCLVAGPEYVENNIVLVRGSDGIIYDSPHDCPISGVNPDGVEVVSYDVQLHPASPLPCWTRMGSEEYYLALGF
jgi:hypothetical protein